jgi:polyisoprenoid-binding protein YceI
MAKEDQTTVGLNKPTMALIGLLITVAGFGAFWKDRGGNEAEAAATHYFVVESNTGRIAATESGLTKVATDFTDFKEETIRRFNDTEKTQITIQADQRAILTGQQEMKAEQTKLSDMMIKKIESDAEIKAWIKSIDKVD